MPLLVYAATDRTQCRMEPEDIVKAMMEPKDIVKAITQHSLYEHDRKECPGLENLTEPHVQEVFLPKHKEWLIQKSKQARQTGSTRTKSGRKATPASTPASTLASTPDSTPASTPASTSAQSTRDVRQRLVYDQATPR
jgi:hypothetical protein